VGEAVGDFVARERDASARVLRAAALLTLEEARRDQEAVRQLFRDLLGGSVWGHSRALVHEFLKAGLVFGAQGPPEGAPTELIDRARKAGGSVAGQLTFQEVFSQIWVGHHLASDLLGDGLIRAPHQSVHAPGVVGDEQRRGRRAGEFGQAEQLGDSLVILGICEPAQLARSGDSRLTSGRITRVAGRASRATAVSLCACAAGGGSGARAVAGIPVLSARILRARTGSQKEAQGNETSCFQHRSHLSPLAGS